MNLAFRPTQSALAVAVFALALSGCRPDYPKCKDDSHCSEHGEVCIDGLCKECSNDTQCKEGFTCKQNACVSLPQCRLDTDCTGGLKCHADKCVPECTTDRECASGEKCAKNKCISAAECTTDSDCAGGRKCGVDQKCVTADAKGDAGADAEAQRRAALAKCTLERVQFEFNEFALSDGARAALDKNAECIRFKNQAVTVEGHADERGTEEYNIVLAEKRANAAKRYVVGLGVEDGKVKTVSFGEEKPVDPGHSEEAWTRNRRAEFLFR